MTLHPVIALVDDTHSLGSAYLGQLAGALNEAIHDDFVPIWRQSGSVGVVDKPGPMQWACHIKKTLDEPGALGYHTNLKNNQPIIYVMLQSPEETAITVAHEVFETLADPYGSRPHSARVPQGIDFHEVGLRRESQHVHYLLEVCDPCEATSYEVGGLPISDFLRPSYYRTNPGVGLAYSFAGGVTEPREVADGGYVSFSRDDGEWFQVFNQGGSLQLEDIGRFDRAQFGSLREFTDTRAREYRASR
jgi:hypothetical protein